MASFQKESVKGTEKGIKGAKLLKAAFKGDSEKVTHLIEEGEADLNFTDANGNTALHAAAAGDSSEVVQILLRKMENVSVENNANETALDIACELSAETVIELLSEEIREKCSRLLREAADETRTNHTVSDPNCEISKVHREIKNTKDKIKSCLESIQKLNETERKGKELTYEEANLLMYFLEVFSLASSGKEEIKRQIVSHFSPCFTEEDRRTIDDARVFLRKKSEKSVRKLTPEDVRKIFIKKDVTSFFRKIKEYVKRISDNRSGGSNETKLCSFLNTPKEDDIDLGDRISNVRSFMMEECKKLIITAFRGEIITAEELFNFLINFHPCFNKNANSDVKEITDLRNELIHQFHNHGCIKLGNNTCSLKSSLFKCYFAQEVSKELNNINPDASPDSIRDYLNKKFKTFTGQFETIYETEIIISQEEAESVINYKLSQSVFPEKDEDVVEDLVDQYLKFMVIFDCENDDDVNGVNYDRKCNSKQRTELNDADRRDIFEKFRTLKGIRSYSSNGYRGEKQKIRDELVNNYQIDGSYFDNVCRSYVEHNEEFYDKDKNAAKKIAKIMRNIKTLKDKGKSLKQISISMYKKFVEENGISDSPENIAFLRYIDEKTHQDIKNALRIDEVLGISVAGKTFYIRTGVIINNMLKTFYNAYHKYQREFNIEEIFNDGLFLRYLISEATEEKDIKVVIKKLLNTEYCAPYIVRLITETNYDNIIEKGDLSKLMQILLQKGDVYLSHLKALLCVKSRNFNFYEELICAVLEQKVNVLKMRDLCVEPNHLKNILGALYKNISRSEQKNAAMDLANYILKFLNVITCELYLSGNYEHALELLDHALTLNNKLIRDHLTKDSDLHVMQAKCQTGRLKNKQGDKQQDRTKKMELHKEALNIFEEIRECFYDNLDKKILFNDPQFFLIKAEIAHTKQLLRQCKKSYEQYVTLHREVIKYALDLTNSESLPDNILNEKMYRDIMESRRYQELLSFSYESGKFLDILDITREMAFSKFYFGQRELPKEAYAERKRCYKEALKIFKNIYQIRKSYAGHVRSRDIAAIALVYTEFGLLLLQRERAQSNFCRVLNYHHLSLQMRIRVYEIKKEKHLPNSPNVLRRRQYLNICLFNIASAYFTVGKILSTPENRKRCEKALELYKTLYETEFHLCGRIHEFTLQKLFFVGDIYQKLERLLEAQNAFETLLDAQRELYGDRDGNVIKTEKRISRIKQIRGQ